MAAKLDYRIPLAEDRQGKSRRLRLEDAGLHNYSWTKQSKKNFRKMDTQGGLSTEDAAKVVVAEHENLSGELDDKKNARKEVREVYKKNPGNSPCRSIFRSLARPVLVALLSTQETARCERS
ncbi:unnamed protein product [Amoebophrya sp. A25]|nr:unnamed protein product [Amoebophrya sp. A25]|eukprot:GSA25T00026995001.1